MTVAVDRNGNRAWLEANFAPLAQEKARDEAAWLRSQLAELSPHETSLRWLDVGCGLGCAREVVDGAYVGIDPIDEAIRRARDRFPDDEFVAGDALSIPFPEGNFDRVLLINVAQMLDEDELAAALKEICRVLRPGGSAFAFWQNFQETGWMHVPGIAAPWWFTLHEAEAVFARAADAGLRATAGHDYGGCYAAVFKKA